MAFNRPANWPPLSSPRKRKPCFGSYDPNDRECGERTSPLCPYRQPCLTLQRWAIDLAVDPLRLRDSLPGRTLESTLAGLWQGRQNEAARACHDREQRVAFEVFREALGSMLPAGVLYADRALVLPGELAWRGTALVIRGIDNDATDEPLVSLQCPGRTPEPTIALPIALDDLPPTALPMARHWETSGGEDDGRPGYLRSRLGIVEGSRAWRVLPCHIGDLGRLAGRAVAMRLGL